MYKKDIEKIEQSKDINKMKGLKDILIELMEHIKEEDYQKYLSYEKWIHSLVYGGHLGKDLAECWVSYMENKDGTKGQHWTYEQTSQVLQDKGLKYDPTDFYAVLNMVYSDYYNNKFDLNTYIELAKDWLNDKDVKNKLINYYYYVVK